MGVRCTSYVSCVRCQLWRRTIEDELRRFFFRFSKWIVNGYLLHKRKRNENISFSKTSTAPYGDRQWTCQVRSSEQFHSSSDHWKCVPSAHAHSAADNTNNIWCKYRTVCVGRHWLTITQMCRFLAQRNRAASRTTTKKFIFFSTSTHTHYYITVSCTDTGWTSSCCCDEW